MQHQPFKLLERISGEVISCLSDEVVVRARGVDIIVPLPEITWLERDSITYSPEAGRSIAIGESIDVVIIAYNVGTPHWIGSISRAYPMQAFEELIEHGHEVFLARVITRADAVRGLAGHVRLPNGIRAQVYERLPVDWGSIGREVPIRIVQIYATLPLVTVEIVEVNSSA